MRTSGAVDLEPERTRRLAIGIERELRRSGARQIVADAAEIDNVRRWRRAAIMAAHRTGQRW